MSAEVAMPLEGKIGRKIVKEGRWERGWEEMLTS